MATELSESRLQTDAQAPNLRLTARRKASQSSHLVPIKGFLFRSHSEQLETRLFPRGFANAPNNGEFVISAITDTTITVTGGTLVTESVTVKASIYEKTKAVTQNRDVVIGGNRYRLQLLKGRRRTH